MDIDIKKLFELIAERLNNPVNMKLDIKAVVKEIPDSKHGTLTTLVVYNTSDDSVIYGSASIDNRIIDDADLYEQKVITEDDEPETQEKLFGHLSHIQNIVEHIKRKHLTHQKERCDNCGVIADDLHEVYLTTDNEPEQYCTACYDAWCKNDKAPPFRTPLDREERKEQFNYFNQYPISDTEHRIHKNSICFKCADIKTCGLARDMWDTPNDYSTFCSAFKPINTEVYDNKGKTLDRYTVIINKAVFTMSLHPLSSQGVNQFAGIVRQLDRASLGKKVDFKQLPQEIKRAIIERMNRMTPPPSRTK